MVTLRQMHNLPGGGEPETENTWFSGYAWTVVYCGCGEHLGWHFTTIRPSAQPATFYGIHRSAIEWH